MKSTYKQHVTCYQLVSGRTTCCHGSVLYAHRKINAQRVFQLQISRLFELLPMYLYIKVQRCMDSVLFSYFLYLSFDCLSSACIYCHLCYLQIIIIMQTVLLSWVMFYINPFSQLTVIAAVILLPSCIPMPITSCKNTIYSCITSTTLTICHCAGYLSPEHNRCNVKLCNIYCCHENKPVPMPGRVCMVRCHLSIGIKHHDQKFVMILRVWNSSHCLQRPPVLLQATRTIFGVVCSF